MADWSYLYWGELLGVFWLGFSLCFYITFFAFTLHSLS